jgi:hypothetical protein
MRIFGKEEALAQLDCCRTREEREELFSEFVEKGILSGMTKKMRREMRKQEKARRTFIVNPDGSTQERLS